LSGKKSSGTNAEHGTIFVKSNKVLYIRDKYKQALRGLFVAGTSIDCHSLCDGSQQKHAASAAKGKRSVMNQD
jgi:hypothetical protein